MSVYDAGGDATLMKRRVFVGCKPCGLKSLALIVLIIAAVANPALAVSQTSSGSLQGVIRDAAGAPVAATVSIKGERTGRAFTTTASGRGGYAFLLLDPDRYTLTVTDQAGVTYRRAR
jgi:hypothetical protein